jgi:hypothetical protein
LFVHELPLENMVEQRYDIPFGAKSQQLSIRGQVFNRYRLRRRHKMTCHGSIFKGIAK